MVVHYLSSLITGPAIIFENLGKQGYAAKWPFRHPRPLWTIAGAIVFERIEEGIDKRIAYQTSRIPRAQLESPGAVTHRGRTRLCLKRKRTAVSSYYRWSRRSVRRQPSWYQMTWFTKRYICYF